MSKVSLISLTPNAEESIVFMARVSNPSNQNNTATAEKLIRFLLKHKHFSPFEMASMCLEIETTRAISPQILRHRSFSFQEFSQRYANAGVIGRPEVPHLRAQDVKNRQNSLDDLSQRLGSEKLSEYYRRIQILFEDADHLYQQMVSDGVAKECARAVLPLATPTRLYMSGTLRSWIHYVQVRNTPETQLEHRQIAAQVQELMYEHLPTLAAAAFNPDPG